jgi:hypothetical protein
VQGIPLKAFGNWRAKFEAKLQLPAPKLRIQLREKDTHERNLKKSEREIRKKKFCGVTHFTDAAIQTIVWLAA